MGIFSDNVTEYFESGLVCIPIGETKAPFWNDWTRWCDQKPSQETIEQWEREYAKNDRFGLCCGKASGIVAFDFDYAYDPARVKISKEKFEKDLKIVEAHLLRALPQTPAIKKGKKGWTRFYRWTPELDEFSNISVDRNGVRLFDFLSWHKQTIMPPSLHSRNSDSTWLKYVWLGPPLLECLDDVPEITMAPVLESRLIFGEKNVMAQNSRHGKLFMWAIEMSKVERDLDKLAALMVVKDKSLGDVKGPYLSDRKHFRDGNALVNARAWLDRIVSWKGTRRELGVQDGGVGAEGWGHFFQNQFPEMRKDILSRKVFVREKPADDWMSFTAIEGLFRANAHDMGLPRGHVADQMLKFEILKKDMDFLCDVPKWDGIDRVKKFAECIVSPNFSFDQMEQILKHWGSGIFRRIANPENQNRCIILKGPQGLGKDSLIKSMLHEFKPYFGTTNLSGTPKDVYEIISRVFVLHIEEFEQTQNLDVAFIKSIITQSSAFFRESYGHEATSKRVALSMISTTNRDDILRDPTGNRRFIVIPLEKIKWEYPRNESTQVVAQLKHYADKGEFEFLPADLEADILAILDAFTPHDTNEFLIEMYIERALALIANLQRYPATSGYRNYLTASEAMPAIAEIAKINGVSLNRARTVIKAAGFSRREKGRYGVIYAASPFLTNSVNK